jgi:hypothetical protein
MGWCSLGLLLGWKKWDLHACEMNMSQNSEIGRFILHANKAGGKINQTETMACKSGFIPF